MVSCRTTVFWSNNCVHTLPWPFFSGDWKHLTWWQTLAVTDIIDDLKNKDYFSSTETRVTFPSPNGCGFCVCVQIDHFKWPLSKSNNPGFISFFTSRRYFLETSLPTARLDKWKFACDLVYLNMISRIKSLIWEISFLLWIQMNLFIEMLLLCLSHFSELPYPWWWWCDGDDPFGTLFCSPLANWKRKKVF